MCYNSDNVLSLSRDNDKYIIFFCDKVIANKLILEKISANTKSLFIVNSYLNFLGNPPRKKSFLSSNFVDWTTELHPFISWASLNPPLIHISDESIERFKHFYSLNKYICFHNRDPLYMAKSIGTDNNFHDYRDFSFSSFSKAIAKLNSSGIACVRLGQIATPSLCVMPAFLDLSNENRSEENELLAIAGSIFLVTGNTGFAHVSRIIRKPQLIINHAPLRIEEFGAYSPLSIIVPKKLFSNSLDRFLTLIESIDFCKKYSIHDQDFFRANRICVVDNTQDEIEAAICEMLLYIKPSENSSECDIDIAIESHLATTPYGQIKSTLKTKISSSFVKMNPFLVD